jgi:hypothetical protein
MQFKIRSQQYYSNFHLLQQNIHDPSTKKTPEGSIQASSIKRLYCKIYFETLCKKKTIPKVEYLGEVRRVFCSAKLLLKFFR